MEIRSDISSLRSAGSFASLTSGADKGAVINITDSLVKAETIDSSYKRPEIRISEAGAAEEIKEVKTGRAGSSFAVMSGADAIPGPSTAMVAAQIQKLASVGFEFLTERSIPIPFMKHKKIDANEAASILSSGDKGKISRLRVKSEKTDPVPITNFNDIGELSAFKGLGTMPGEAKDLAEFLKYAGGIGLEFKTDDAKNVGEYGAYNLLTTGWGIAGQNSKPVELVREGVSIMTLKPGENRSPQDLKKELEETWSAVDKLKTFEKTEKYYNTLGKPFQDMSFVERFRAFDCMDKYCGRALANYEIAVKHAGNRKEFTEMVEVLDKQELIGYRKNSEFDPEDVEIMMKKVIPNDLSVAEKADILRGLRHHISKDEFEKGKKAFVRSSFQLVQKNSGDGKDFLRLSKLYLSMASAIGIGLKGYDENYPGYFENAKKTFGFITDQLNGKQTESEVFIGLLNGNSMDEAKKRFQFIQTPVKNEDIATRVKVAHALNSTAGFEENYKAVLENTDPGKNPMDLVNLMKRIRGAYKEDDFNSKKTFVDVKQLIALNGLSVPEGNEAMSILVSSLEKGIEGLRTLSSPIGNESFDVRKNLLAKLRSNYGTDKGSERTKREYLKYDDNSLEDYKLITSTLLKGETLEDAGNRFQMVFDGLGGYKHIQEVRDAYNVITEGAKNGGSALTNELIQKALLNGKNKSEVRKILREGIDEAARQFKDPIRHSNGKIVQDEEKVIIGGVKLDKQKYENLLKVLDQPGK